MNQLKILSRYRNKNGSNHRISHLLLKRAEFKIQKTCFIFIPEKIHRQSLEKQQSSFFADRVDQTVKEKINYQSGNIIFDFKFQTIDVSKLTVIQSLNNSNSPVMLGFNLVRSTLLNIFVISSGICSTQVLTHKMLFKSIFVGVPKSLSKTLAKTLLVWIIMKCWPSAIVESADF